MQRRKETETEIWCGARRAGDEDLTLHQSVSQSFM